MPMTEPELVVIVPSRGRPAAVVELERAFRDTCAAGTRLMFAFDDDDPDLPAALPADVHQLVGRHQSMVEALNHAAAELLAGPCAPQAIGFMGDDHRPRTPGWDRAYLDALTRAGGGVVYGNDLVQRQQLATQCAISADIVQALGYMAPPELHHLYVDNFWMSLGTALGRLTYLPDVVVEHCHPFAGTGVWDAGYQRVNAPGLYERDAAAFDAYSRSRFAEDVGKVLARRPATVP
jgi:hypothetical protein